MKAIQENKTSQMINPFNNSQINQPVVYRVKEEASVYVQPGIAQWTVNQNTTISFPDTVIKYIDNQMHSPFFTGQAVADMTSGLIPNFEELYHFYLEIEPEVEKLLPAINFLPALREFSLTKEEIASLLNNPEPTHILVQNDQVKIIVRRWEPGDISNIHGHSIGGGLLKVLHGEIEEKRYTTDSQQRLLSESTYLTDHIAYIDDAMGLHSVENSEDSPAMTLHIYTPGKYKAKKYEKAH